MDVSNNINHIGRLIEMGVATGVAALTITRARPIRPLRDWIFLHSLWWGELISCPYCMSHWIAAVFILWAWPGLHAAMLEWLVVVGIAAPSAAAVYSAVVTILPAQSEETSYAQPIARAA